MSKAERAARDAYDDALRHINEAIEAVWLLPSSDGRYHAVCALAAANLHVRSLEPITQPKEAAL